MRRTHEGRLFGVPVYFDFTDPEVPGVEARWQILEPVLGIMEGLFGLFCAVYEVTLAPEDWEPMYPMLVGRKIDPLAPDPA